MRERYQSITKFDSPFAKYLYGSDTFDDEDSTESGWVARVGRRVLVESEQGFVFYFREEDEGKAREVYRELFVDLGGEVESEA